MEMHIQGHTGALAEGYSSSSNLTALYDLQYKTVGTLAIIIKVIDKMIGSYTHGSIQFIPIIEHGMS